MMIGWHDLRGTCKVCNERAGYSVEYTNNDADVYLRNTTRLEYYCVDHLPDKIAIDIASMMKAAQNPPGL